MNGRFTQEDTHWTVGNMIYDKSGSVSIEAIMQSGNLYGYCGNNPVLYVDPTGEEWYHWAIAGGLVVGAVVATVVTAGGALPAIYAVGSVASGVAAGTTASTVAAGALIGSSAALGGAFVMADLSSTESFNQSANWGTVAGTFGGTALGMGYGYAIGSQNSTDAAGGVCFVAGTLISTENGLLAIENIVVGDAVYSQNTDTGEKGIKRVAQTFVRQSDELVFIRIDGQSIVTTPEHPFYVSQKGWTNAIELCAGDNLVLQSGKFKIVENVRYEILEKPVDVYNFEVEDWHTYYVSNVAVLVHNTCGMNNLRTLKDTTIKGYKVSMDLERGGSGLTNIHLKVGNMKYFYSNNGKFINSAGKEIPNALRNNSTIKKSLEKALQTLEKGW